MKRKKRIVYWVTAFLAIAIISSGVYAKTPITIYSSVHEDVLAAIAKEFNSRTPDVELKYFRLGTTKIIAKVNAEVKASRHTLRN